MIKSDVIWNVYVFYLVHISNTTTRYMLLIELPECFDSLIDSYILAFWYDSSHIAIATVSSKTWLMLTFCIHSYNWLFCSYGYYDIIMCNICKMVANYLINNLPMQFSLLLTIHNLCKIFPFVAMSYMYVISLQPQQSYVYKLCT